MAEWFPWMPELPEVETVARDLRPLLVGRRIMTCHFSGKKLRLPWRDEWLAEVCGCQITSLTRRAKWLYLSLKKTGLPHGAGLIVHLGMTGQLTVVQTSADHSPKNWRPQDHIHLRMLLLSGVSPEDSLYSELLYRDARRFGGIHFFANQNELDIFYEAHPLGPEPWDCPLVDWVGKLAGTSRRIKTVLLDQKIISGIGNIYADESLHAAGIHPTRCANSLDQDEAARLLAEASGVMLRAINNRGSSIRDYVGGENLRGNHQDYLAVYGREGLACVRCGGQIQRLRIGGRSSHFCTVCQRFRKSPGRKKGDNYKNIVNTRKKDQA